MMKTRLFMMAMLAMVLLVGCKDDDNENNSGGNDGTEQTDAAMSAADRFWAVAANLVSPFEVTADYESKTFEPTIGEPLDGDETVRVVNATDHAVAAAMFAAITEAPVDENTTTYTFEDDAVGTMTYNKSTDGQSLATVDVNIKQIPHLQRIVYMTPEQLPENAQSGGVPYYSFGDVIARPNKDGTTEYWICVHSAFTPQGQTDTYWVTLSPLPKENVQNYKGSNGINYNMPTGIGKNLDRMQNLAELLYAIAEPQQWEDNTQLYNTPKAFGDIKKDNVKYINHLFWKRVRAAWEENDLSMKLFGYEQLDDVTSQLTDDGLHLVYNGYSWLFSSSDYCKLWERIYKNGTGNKANAHDMTYREIKQEMIKSRTTLDCIGEYKQNHWVNEQFFGDDSPRFIFRFATGKQLLGKQPGVYNSMAGGKAGISDVYVYTQRFGIAVGDHVDMEQLEPDSGLDAHYHSGDVYIDEEGHHWIVTYMAGDIFDYSPYTELVSFDAVKYSNDGSYMTNAPTKDEMLRGFAGIWYLAHSCFAYNFNKELSPTASGTSSIILRNLQKEGIDPRAILLKTDREEGARNYTEHASLPYRVSGDSKQRIMRFLMTSDLGQSDLHFNFWEHYPANPSDTSKYYNNFTIVPIFLQDAADSAKVKAYGKDYYAGRPIFFWGKTQEARKYRTEPTEQAKKVSNYAYSMKEYVDGINNTGMWNEPVIVACYDAVLDYGDKNYSKQTVKGRTLTPSSLVPLSDEEEVGKVTLSAIKRFWQPYSELLHNAYHIDGEPAEFPSFTIWQ